LKQQDDSGLSVIIWKVSILNRVHFSMFRRSGKDLQLVISLPPDFRRCGTVNRTNNPVVYNK